LHAAGAALADAAAELGSSQTGAIAQIPEQSDSGVAGMLDSTAIQTELDHRAHPLQRWRDARAFARAATRTIGPTAPGQRRQASCCTPGDAALQRTKLPPDQSVPDLRYCQNVLYIQLKCRMNKLGR